MDIFTLQSLEYTDWEIERKGGKEVLLFAHFFLYFFPFPFISLTLWHAHTIQHTDWSGTQ